MKLRFVTSAVLLFVMQVAHSVENDGTFNLLVENDAFVNSDDQYTSGIQLSAMSGADAMPSWLRHGFTWLPGIDEKDVLRVGFQLGHNIYTPGNTETESPVTDDRPYAAKAYGALAVMAESDSHLHTWLLDVGVIGPQAGGESIQNRFHDLIGSDELKGWDNQLGDEVVAALVYEHKWRNLLEARRLGLGIDLTPHAGFSLGNFATYLNLGATLRIGNDLRSDFGPPRIRPSLPGSAFFTPQDGFGWYLFAGVDGRAVGYNILLDGNTNQDSLSVEREDLVGDIQAGLVLTFRTVRVAYTHIYRSREFKGQEEGDRFGSLAISFKF